MMKVIQWLMGILFCWLHVSYADSQITEETLIIANRYSPQSIMGARLSLVSEEIRLRTHIHLSYVNLPAARSLKLAQNGGIDGEVMRVKALEDMSDVSNLVRVNAPWASLNLIAFHKPNLFTEEKPWLNMDNYTACHVRGAILPEKTARQNKAKKILAVATQQQIDQIEAALHRMEHSV